MVFSKKKEFPSPICKDMKREMEIAPMRNQATQIRIVFSNLPQPVGRESD